MQRGWASAGCLVLRTDPGGRQREPDAARPGLPGGVHHDSGGEDWSSASMSSRSMSAAGAKALHDMMTWRGVPGPDWHSGQVRGEGQPACVAHVAVRAATSAWRRSVQLSPMARWHR